MESQVSIYRQSVFNTVLLLLLLYRSWYRCWCCCAWLIVMVIVVVVVDGVRCVYSIMRVMLLIWL